MAKAGQPTKYNKDMLDKAKYYLANWESESDVIPSIDRLALVLGVARRTLINWRDMEGNEEFLQTLEDIKAQQKLTLLNKGLDGTFNSNITKLALGNHGLHERKELSGPEGKPIPVMAIDVSSEEASKIYDDIIS